jgi:hypothetical protein
MEGLKPPTPMSYLAKQSKSAIIGYIGALFMIIGLASAWPRQDAQSNIFKAINLAGATAAICLAGLCQHTKKD